MKFLHIIFLLIFFMSCQSKDVKIPVNDNPGIHEVWDNSPIYILMQVDGQDTIADVKLGQTVSTTKWLVAADRRLSLKQLRPALDKVLKKRHKKSIHSDGKGRLYLSYLDSVQQKVSFVEASNLKLMPEYFTSKSYFKQYKQADKDFDKIHLKVFSKQFVLNDSVSWSGNLSKQDLSNRIKLWSKEQNLRHPKLYLNFDEALSYNRFLDLYTFFKNDSLSMIQLSPKIFIFTP